MDSISFVLVVILEEKKGLLSGQFSNSLSVSLFVTKQQLLISRMLFGQISVGQSLNCSLSPLVS